MGSSGENTRDPASGQIVALDSHNHQAANIRCSINRRGERCWNQAVWGVVMRLEGTSRYDLMAFCAEHWNETIHPEMGEQKGGGGDV